MTNDKGQIILSITTYVTAYKVTHHTQELKAENNLTDTTLTAENMRTTAESIRAISTARL